MTQSGILSHGRLASGRTAFLFDLDGTLVDSVYQHVLAWREAMAGVGIELAVWSIHRRIGMSGGLMANAILRETGHAVTAEEAGRLLRLHAEAYARLAESGPSAPRRPGAAAIPDRSRRAVGHRDQRSDRECPPTIESLGIPAGVPIVTRDQVGHAKPDPDLFLAAAERLGVPIGDSVVVGDSVWDLLAARRAAPRRGAALRRLRTGRARARGSVPRLSGSRRPAAAPRRSRGPFRGMTETANEETRERDDALWIRRGGAVVLGAGNRTCRPGSRFRRAGADRYAAQSANAQVARQRRHHYGRSAVPFRAGRRKGRGYFCVFLLSERGPPAAGLHLEPGRSRPGKSGLHRGRGQTWICHDVHRLSADRISLDRQLSDQYRPRARGRSQAGAPIAHGAIAHAQSGFVSRKPRGSRQKPDRHGRELVGRIFHNVDDGYRSAPQSQLLPVWLGESATGKRLVGRRQQEWTGPSGSGGARTVADNARSRVATIDEKNADRVDHRDERRFLSAARGHENLRNDRRSPPPDAGAQLAPRAAAEAARRTGDRLAGRAPAGKAQVSPGRAVDGEAGGGPPGRTLGLSGGRRFGRRHCQLR